MNKKLQLLLVGALCIAFAVTAYTTNAESVQSKSEETNTQTTIEQTRKETKFFQGTPCRIVSQQRATIGHFFRDIEKFVIHIQNYDRVREVMPVEDYKSLINQVIQGKYEHCNPNLKIIFEDNRNSELFHDPSNLGIFIGLSKGHNQNNGKAYLKVKHYRDIDIPFSSYINTPLFFSGYINLEREHPKVDPLKLALTEHLLYKMEYFSR